MVMMVTVMMQTFVSLKPCIPQDDWKSINYEKIMQFPLHIGFANQFFTLVSKNKLNKM